MSGQAFSFSTKPKLVPVEIDGVAHVLRQAFAGDGVAYQNAKRRAAKFNDQGNFAGIDGGADAEVIAVGLCLFAKEQFEKGRGDGRDGRPVGEAFARELPLEALAGLFKWLDENSTLDPPASADVLRRQIEVMQRQLKALEDDEAKKRPAV